MLAIVIPTFRRPTYAAAVVEQVLAQRAPTDEIVVVDQSPDDEARWLQERVGARVVTLRREPGLPAARNAAIAATSAPVIVFLDDDVILRPGFLDAHRAAFADPSVGAAVGQIHERVLRPNAPPTTNEVGPGGRIRVNLTGGASVDVAMVKGANMSLRRSALGEAGLFDEVYAGTALLEDADLSARLRACGWRIRYLPDAALEHLSAPHGGVRPDSRAVGEGWRFHNTGVYVARNRGVVGKVRAGVTFAAIAARRAVEHRDPALFGALVTRFAEGLRAGSERRGRT